MKESTLSRHGDLAFTPIEKMPVGLKEVYKGNKYILARGEFTGHYHELQTKTLDGFRVLRDKSNAMFLEMLSDGKVTHQEHKTITLKKGLYSMGIEREYDYFLEAI